ncbi:MAG: phosphatidylinositol-specific phospholipase C1-like protein [Polyangiaceae bacterium]
MFDHHDPKKATSALCLLLGACLLPAGCSLEAKMRLNELQVLGSHNSYHIEPEPELLAAIASSDANAAASLEYTALPLVEQLERGVRQLELDLFADPEGGRYASRAGLLALGRDPSSGLPELDEPGLKVLHIQDLDFQTHCLTFLDCLEQIASWSDDNPQHLPLLVMIEAKQDPIDDPLGLGFVTPLPFDAAALDGVDAEIRSRFAPERLITPDDVRGDYSTLEAALLDRGWPTLIEARGRILFALLDRGVILDRYLAGHRSLEGRVMFANSAPGRPEASFFNRDSALVDGDEIAALVRAGYLVRTRADIDTLEARSGDIRLREAAFASGAQYVSTDYVVPDPDFVTGYSAAVPGGHVARCNPLTAPLGCNSGRLSELETWQPSR